MYEKQTDPYLFPYILPICSPKMDEKHPTLFGTGVLIEWEERMFLVTANHVRESIEHEGRTDIYVPLSHQGKKDFYSIPISMLAYTPSDASPGDICVYHLERSLLEDSLRNSLYTSLKVTVGEKLSETTEEKVQYFISGFPEDRFIVSEFDKDVSYGPRFIEADYVNTKGKVLNFRISRIDKDGNGVSLHCMSGSPLSKVTRHLDRFEFSLNGIAIDFTINNDKTEADISIIKTDVVIKHLIEITGLQLQNINNVLIKYVSPI
ncbi:hypothetical protein A0128_20325 [Leptospira tipperaryensis]|uniref:Serine protease n=1 Tax=Leptospira tipperaryensis TaxID=2564040 RepID=A0A1D7V3F1_9LEPT|nr:hypothetical protein [Leptospira tipperaryensis]AOP36367.1 hypothetical protein A0128_20325 [Leptospira tipperaryensis]